MKFSTVIGQSQPKQLLRRLADEGRIPHAQIFLGPKGCGKLALAIAFAQYVLCEQRSDGDSCGTCRSCSKVSKYIHPDVHYSFPTVGTKAVSSQYTKEWRAALEENPYLNVNQWLAKLGGDNKQGNITKDECDSIVKKLSLKSFESDYKVLIMWLPEYLGKEGNRLLKLIEEPPERTLFLLVAENDELILNTILSRCQLLKLHPPTEEEIIAQLEADHGVAATKALNAARLAGGDYNEAMRLVNDLEDDNAKVFVEWFRECYQGNGEKLVEWSNDKAAKLGREGQKQLLDYALLFLREVLAYKMTGDRAMMRLQPAEAATAERMANVLDHDQVGAMMTLFDEVYYHVERNANGKLLFLDTSIRLHRIFRKKH